MRFVRLLGITILIYGLSYMRHVVTQMYLHFTHAPNAAPRFVVANLNIGIVMFMLGIGLLLTKEWARISWLMSSIALLALHTVILFLPRGSNFTMPVLNFVLIVLLALVSFWKLTRPDIKELFN